MINLSLGINGAAGEVYDLIGSLAPMQDAIVYAWEKGAVVIAAAGNDTFPMCGSPATEEFVVCVGATGPSGDIASYSNFDALAADTFLVAPGGEPAGLTCDSFILSTYPIDKTPTGCAPPDQVGYDVNSGTSMAAPFVSGVAALLAEEGLDNEQIVDCLARTAKDLGEPGRDPIYGFGLVRANKAVKKCRK